MSSITQFNYIMYKYYSDKWIQDRCNMLDTDSSIDLKCDKPSVEKINIGNNKKIENKGIFSPIPPSCIIL